MILQLIFEAIFLHVKFEDLQKLAKASDGHDMLIVIVGKPKLPKNEGEQLVGVQGVAVFSEFWGDDDHLYEIDELVVVELVVLQIGIVEQVAVVGMD